MKEEAPTAGEIASRILSHWVHNTPGGDTSVCALVAKLAAGLHTGNLRLLPEAQPQESAWAGALLEELHQSPPAGVIGEQLQQSAARRVDAVILVMRALLEDTPGSENGAEISPFLDEFLWNLGPVDACLVEEVMQKAREDIRKVLSGDGAASVQ